jgi:lipopolysaccharide biosynthesis regulator YciM
MNTDTSSGYTSQHISGLYSLARMFFISGLDSKAENICLGLLALSEQNALARLLIASIHLERGNFSLAANHFRIAAQDEMYSIQARIGLLACYSALIDIPRASMVAEEMELEKGKLSEELDTLFDLLKRSIELKKNLGGKL